MSEARDPQRDVPFAMAISFLSVTLIYVLVQIVVIRVLPDPAQTDRPLAIAARYSWARRAQRSLRSARCLPYSAI